MAFAAQARFPEIPSIELQGKALAAKSYSVGLIAFYKFGTTFHQPVSPAGQNPLV